MSEIKQNPWDNLPELSKAASEKRSAEHRTREAYNWYRNMKRTFKGITGGLTRREYAAIARAKFRV